MMKMMVVVFVKQVMKMKQMRDRESNLEMKVKEERLWSRGQYGRETLSGAHKTTLNGSSAYNIDEICFF